MAFEKINEFAADKQKLCVEHDTISDELFREYGVCLLYTSPSPRD